MKNKDLPEQQGKPGEKKSPPIKKLGDKIGPADGNRSKKLNVKDSKKEDENAGNHKRSAG